MLFGMEIFVSLCLRVFVFKKALACLTNGCAL